MGENMNNSVSKHILFLSKSVLFISIAALVILATYLIYTNPEYNHIEKIRILKKEKEIAKERGAAVKKWKYDMFSDVDVRSEKYPIVVLRTGFKVIRVDADTSLVGWKYEIVNTSPKTKYTTRVNFSIEDADGFLIKEGDGKSIVQPNGLGVVTGTITIPNADLDRLSSSGWTIALSPDWEIKEKNTKGKRYARLGKILKGNSPSWVDEEVKNKFIVMLSEKWAAISESLAPRIEKDAKDKSDENSN